jgi:hypothetical protein
MDDVVAIEVSLADGDVRYFLTWGRVQDTVDPGPVCDLVLRASAAFSLGGKPVTARMCTTLREAAQSPNAPYFYECFLTFCHQPIPYGEGYEAWRTATDLAMRAGKEISYCGRPPEPNR